MDQLKLEMWKQRFDAESATIQREFKAFFLETASRDYYTIRLDESDEWELLINDDVPDEIKQRFEQSFQFAKPEDSV
ncbi:MAG: hypothetical protein EOP49_00075 [Sphingobacteriales bacterium]|nr:MAG: hypothetical protein EOP49_00075 [Sphingobacteriales bacterium]